MTLKTRWFGKKVKGDALKSLVSALGENPDNLLLSPEESRWSTRNTHGRASFTPIKDGVSVDLYVFREDYHIKDGTIPADNYGLPSLYGNHYLSSDVDNNLLIQNYEAHIQGEIKYSLNKDKLNSGTGTGTGAVI